jgi:hypothetical protein
MNETVQFSKVKLNAGAGAGVRLALCPVAIWYVFFCAFLGLQDYVQLGLILVLAIFYLPKDLKSALLCLIQIINGLKVKTKNRPGLVLSDSYLQDDSNAAPLGKIMRSDVIAIERVHPVYHDEAVKLTLADPNAIPEYDSGLPKLLRRLIVAVYGSPVIISPNCLNITGEDLYKRLVAWHGNDNKAAHNPDGTTVLRSGLCK